MRELAVNTFLTLDGVMQAPGGPDEDTSGGFEHGGWSVNFWDESMMEAMGEATSGPFDMLLGRRTYEIMAAHWPHASAEEGADTFNNARKHVASATLAGELEWQNSTLIEGDVAKAVAELKQEDGPELQVHGSRTLIQTLLENELVDELRLWIFPVVLGSGMRLFGEGTVPSGLELTASRVSSTGVVMATYRAGGKVEVGSFALEVPGEAEVGHRGANAAGTAGN